MKITNNIATLLAGIAFLASCSDDVAPTYTVGEADNAIVLRAGISEGGSGVQTRAGAEDHHSTPGHKLFTTGTAAALRIDGDWWKQGAGSATLVTQPTTATMGGKSATEGNGQLHNSLTMSPQLYWDDYGTADPNNTADGRGRKKGLTIYGAAVDGVTTAPTVDNWTALSWTLDADQKTNNWNTKDLLISNNVKDGTGDGCFKFDTDPRTKLLEFTHAMSKITVRLIASEGFPITGDGLIGNTANKFKKAPEVTLTSNEGTATTNTEWPNTSGTVDITTGGITGQANPAKVQMHTATVPEDQKATYTAILDALVMPGSCFGTTDEAIIARINADDNIYYVTAKEIRTKMHSLNSSTDYKTESGKNYIITVNVKKTKIEVTATIKNWVDVEAETIEPVISVSGTVGAHGATDGTFNSFGFYLSTTAASGYSKSAKATGTPDGSAKWIFKDGSDQTITLHWPTHNTHYFMRGVSPSTATVVEQKHIVVNNGQYNSSTSPSNLLIGAPEITTGTMCGSPEHTQVDMSDHGICARNNTINLNFQYVMSQVEVRLKSTGTDALKNKVTIDGNTTVEIIGGYERARILLNTRVHDDYTDADKVDNGKYTLHSRALTSEETTAGIIKSAMHDIIVPQLLTDDMKFRITVTNSDGTKDVYEAQLNKIKVKTNDGSGALITEWKPGEHYIYELDIKKTEINVTATLTDWKVVTATEDVWF